MNKFRFKMSFNDSGYVRPTNNEIHNLISNKNIIKPQPTFEPIVAPPILNTRNIQVPGAGSILNTPMINRVHKAKPGCSACGKKVA